MKKLSLVSLLVLVTVTAFWVGEARGQMGGGCPTSADLFPEEVYEKAGQAYLRTNKSGKVKVEVTYISPGFWETLKTMKDKIEPARLATLEKYQEKGKNILFAVGLSTHMGSLSDYRMEQISFLKDAQGREYQAVDWKEGLSAMPSMPSHHRAGILIFPKVDDQGNPIINDKTKVVEIVIKGVAGVKKRTFKWKLSPA